MRQKYIRVLTSAEPDLLTLKTAEDDDSPEAVAPGILGSGGGGAKLMYSSVLSQPTDAELYIRIACLEPSLQIVCLCALANDRGAQEWDGERDMICRISRRSNVFTPETPCVAQPISKQSLFALPWLSTSLPLC